MCNCETACLTLFSFKRVLHKKNYAMSSSQALSCRSTAWVWLTLKTLSEASFLRVQSLLVLMWHLSSSGPVSQDILRLWQPLHWSSSVRSTNTLQLVSYRKLISEQDKHYVSGLWKECFVSERFVQLDHLLVVQLTFDLKLVPLGISFNLQNYLWKSLW